MRAPVARADSAAFRRRLPRQPAKPGDGKLAEEPSAERPRAKGEARGPLCGALPRARRKSERAARLVLLVEAAAAAAAPPPTVPPPHTASGSLTHTRWEGRGLAGGRGRREGTGPSHSGRRCRGALWSLGSCSSPTEGKKGYIVEASLSLCTAHARGERVSLHCYYGHRHTKEENLFSAAD